MSEKTDEAQFTIRCSYAMRDAAETAARNQGQSLAEWIRRAIQEKLDRDAVDNVSDDDLDARIERVLTRMLKEKGVEK